MDMEMAKKFLKTLLCMIMVLVCAAPACLPSAEAAKAAKILRVNAENVRLHYNTKGGGESSMILKLPKGTNVLFLDTKDKAWAYVALPNGLRGYVYNGYLSEYGAVNAKDVAQVKSSKLATYKVSGRTMKKTGSSLTRNSVVFVRDTKGGFARVLTLAGKWTYVKTSGLQKFSK